MEVYIGTILPWAGTYAPRDWDLCDGRILSIADNQALFAVIGTIYGGDGRNTFALPDLRGRMPIGAGYGPGLSRYVQGQTGGAERVLLSVNEIPAHNHASSGIPASTRAATVGQPGPQIVPGSYQESRGKYYNIYSPESDANTSLKPGGPTGNTGGNQPYYNLPPFLVVNYIICTEGLYPPRD